MQEFQFDNPNNKRSVYRGTCNVSGWLFASASDPRREEDSFHETSGDGRQNCRLLQDLRALGVDT
jgi:hypothetical protein